MAQTKIGGELNFPKAFGETNRSRQQGPGKRKDGKIGTSNSLNSGGVKWAESWPREREWAGK